MAHKVLHSFKTINLPFLNVYNELFVNTLRIQSRSYASKKPGKLCFVRILYLYPYNVNITLQLLTL